MAVDTTAALLDRWRKAWARRDVVALASTYAENCVLESPTFGTVIGRDAVQRAFHNWFTAFPDASVEFADAPIVTGDRVVQSLTAVGTDTGGFLGQSPTGRPFRVFVVLLYHIVDGRIVHERRVLDITGLLLQLARGDNRAPETSRVYRGVLEATRLEHEMKIAAEIQRGLFPAPHYKGAGFELAATSLPCRAIGGDFLDYFDLADGKFGFVLGDVAGKGPPAALLAAKIQGMLAAYSDATRTPSETVTLVNRELVRRVLESRFATLLYGVLSADGRLTYCNAGHNPALILGRCGVHQLASGGVPVGLFTDSVFEEETVQLDQDDVLVVFSDGVVESLNRDHAEFGEERLLSSITAHRHLPPALLLDRVMTTIHEFAANTEQHDDITTLILRYSTK